MPPTLPRSDYVLGCSEKVHHHAGAKSVNHHCLPPELAQGYLSIPLPGPTDNRTDGARRTMTNDKLKIPCRCPTPTPWPLVLSFLCHYCPFCPLWRIALVYSVITLSFTVPDVLDSNAFCSFCFFLPRVDFCVSCLRMFSCSVIVLVSAPA